MIQIPARRGVKRSQEGLKKDSRRSQEVDQVLRQDREEERDREIQCRLRHNREPYIRLLYISYQACMINVEYVLRSEHANTFIDKTH